ncbi:hypothetical protein KCV06_g295, partial [Aureobasidium melanogenum]
LVYLQAWWNRSGYWEQFTAPEDICTSLLLLVGSPARLFSARLFYSPKPHSADQKQCTRKVPLQSLASKGLSQVLLVQVLRSKGSQAPVSRNLTPSLIESLFPIIVRRLRATYPHELVAQQPKVPLKPSTRDVTSILALIVWPTRFGCRSRPCNLEESAQQVRTHVEALRRSTQIDVVLRFLRAAVAVRRTVGCQRLMRTTRQIVLAEEQFRESSVVKVVE